MIKRIIHYQKMLGLSCSKNEFSLSIMFLIAPTVAIFNYLEGIAFILIGLIYVYAVATGNKNPHNLLPVSKKFALINLYLLVVLFSVFVFLILSVIFCAGMGVILFVNKPAYSDMGDLSLFSIKTIILYVLVVLITIMVVTTISVIRNKRQRYKAIIIYNAITFVLLLFARIVHLKIEVYIVLCSVFFVISTPLLFRFAYKEYMKENGCL